MVILKWISQAILKQLFGSVLPPSLHDDLLGLLDLVGLLASLCLVASQWNTLLACFVLLCKLDLWRKRHCLFQSLFYKNNLYRNSNWNEKFCLLVQMSSYYYLKIIYKENPMEMQNILILKSFIKKILLKWKIMPIGLNVQLFLVKNHL